MFINSLLVLLFLPIFALSQNATRIVITSTSLSAFVTQGSTATSTFVFTTTQQVVLSPNSTASSNSSASATASGNATSSSRTTTSQNLPTAPTSIDGGGGNGAPVPGATGGAYGPGDGYIAAAIALKQNALAVGVAGFVLGGALLVL
ncbi:uncharacterized protein LACBIDRAFT_291493 [Laccaria bicolor S238N-H82]|uniref:Predicted protein n=1 Tax=Laccaria bicolor (strain S238N-H82 / ATCC MYA-4686) TaxID=486041 RepID=B0CQ27_LACBS|nr:uncharacterized protein LACBIDRAFT_291493 [Laccaria bicolor S238N-H82]EDR15603.1 predicted protein [Laccaria bicolor S238N-H82]|eukprot:XP_001873811.1 predicted protein [Laccaria bicolor S238N-H82]